MSGHPRLVVFGGGGFTHDADPSQEAFLLTVLGSTAPSIGYIGAANDDNPDRLGRFYQRFAGRAGRLSHLPADANAAEAITWLVGLDLVYVAGGNTVTLLKRWRRAGLDALLRAAAVQGTWLAGVSAGANCWFDKSLSDSTGAGLAPLRGIGIVPGSCCPHYSTEPERRPAFERLVGAGILPDGIAIDDGAGVVVEGGVPTRVVSARPGAWAYRVARAGVSAVSSTPLPARR